MFNIILAAGLSSRMKKNKLLLTYQNKTFLHHIIKSSFEANLDIIVVTGCYKEEITKEIDFLEKLYSKKIYTTYNRDYEFGQLSSLITGVKKLITLNNTKPYFISVGDTPLLSKEDFIKLIPELKNHDALRPCVNNTFGHPVLINPILNNEIINLEYKNKKEGLRSFLKNKDTLAFPSNNLAYIQDIDTIEAYNKLICNPSS
ncbi:MAG: nucleotidyltransferase family protein [Pleomorphochaeta sp.]